MTPHPLRIGLIARADNTGLGVQTHGFYKHMKPSKTMVVDISAWNGYQQFPERYPDGIFIKGFPTPEDIDSFLQDLDVVFVAEAPYNYHLYARAHELGVKTAVQYNYEFFDWFAHPDYPKPDMLIAPSQWNYQVIEDWCKANDVQHIYLHCPVDRDIFKFFEAKKATDFLHVAGRSASHDRNGTKTVIEASRHLRTDAQIIVHFQGEQGLAHQTTMTTQDYRNFADDNGDEEHLTIVTNEFANNKDIYAMGDVLLLPRRYGGNCLPLNEALSTGMPALMTDIDPNDKFLPKEWLLPAVKIGEFEPRTTIDIYDADPITLARRIDRFFEMTEHEFMTENVRASNIAESISWGNMAWKYQQALESLCN